MSNKKRSTRKSGNSDGFEELKPEKVKKESPYVFQRDKVNYELKVKELPWTPKQKEIIDLILDKKTKIVFLSGPAGTSKTILSAYCAL
jgi:predicted ribonuclease YlaK